jgi:hypothetical protein
MWDAQQPESQIWQITHKHEGYTYTFEGNYQALQEHLMAQALKQFDIKRTTVSPPSWNGLEL